MSPTTAAWRRSTISSGRSWLNGVSAATISPLADLAEATAIIGDKALTCGVIDDNQPAICDIFHSSHKEMIDIRTPCSGAFTAVAEKAAAFVDLPLRWMDADLVQFEAILAETIGRKQQEPA